MPTHNKQRFCKKDCNPNFVQVKTKELSLDPPPQIETTPVEHDHAALDKKLAEIRQQIPIKRGRPALNRDFQTA